MCVLGFVGFLVLVVKLVKVGWFLKVDMKDE
jgi:hypothetical protein